MLNHLAMPALWGLGLLISEVLFDGLSCKDGYTLIFSWWLTAYFIRWFEIGGLQLIAQFGFAVLILSGIFGVGAYEVIYHDAPEKLSPAFAGIILLHAVIAVSPGIFGKLTAVLGYWFKRKTEPLKSSK